MDGQQPSKQADIFLGLSRVCMALKTLQCCGYASSLEQKCTLRAIYTLNNPKNYIRLLKGLSPIHSTRQCRAQGLMWGARGQFLPAGAMVVVFVMPVVFCAKATEIFNKTLNLVFCKQCFYLLLCIAKHIAIHVMLIVAWPKPEPLWSNGIPAYWVSPESSKHHQGGRIIINWPQHRNK
jgi:hypothetical protein